MRYFRRYFPPGVYPAQSADIPIYLHVSTTRLFVHLDRAVRRLADAILRLAQPSFMAERPADPGVLFGRDKALSAVRSALERGHSVTISGPAGVGKTTLALAATGDRPAQMRFWHTFLPNFNDNMPSLLTAIAFFLHRLGRSVLWLQLAAERESAPNPDQALGIIRGELGRMTTLPLFCFDEVDLLHTSDGDARSTVHSQMLGFLEALGAYAPVLYVGQRGYIDTRAHFALEPLGPEAVREMLASAELGLSARQVAAIQETTGGLPRLVELVIALVRAGEDVDEIARLHLRADARPLFNRLWRRLGRREKELLVSLSVFRRAVPVESFAPNSAAQQSLIRRGLLSTGSDGRLVQLPFFRGLIYEELSAGQRETAHAQAGRLRASLGEYVAAVYHLVHAGETEAAIDLWYQNRDLEIARGQAGAALDVFANLSDKRLPTRSQRRLRVIRNQLLLLAGHARQVIENPLPVTWKMDDTLPAEAQFQLGEAFRQLGRHDEALDHFDRALQEIVERQSMVSDMFWKRGMMYMRDGDMRQAWQEARRAHRQATGLDGFLAMVSGDFRTAVKHLEEALQMSGEELPSDRLATELHRHLGFAQGSLGNMEAAERHYRIAMEHYERAGNIVGREGVRADVAGMYLNVRAFERVIDAAEQALRFFEQIGHDARITQLSSDLAEAYLETGDNERALEYANRVLQSENPRFRPYALYTLGLAHQRRGRPDYAAESFRQGIETARTNGDRFIEAYLHRNHGRLCAEQGDTTAALAALETSLAKFRDMGIAHEIAATESDLAVLTA